MNLFPNRLSRWIPYHVIFFLIVTLSISFLSLSYLVSHELEELNEQRCIARKDNIEALLVNKHDSLIYELKEAVNNNSLRVNLMLALDHQVKEFMESINFINGISLIVLNNKFDIFTSQTELSPILINTIIQMVNDGCENNNYFFHKIDNKFYWIFYEDIIQRNNNIGKAILVYRFIDDKSLFNYLRESDDHIVIMQDNNPNCLVNIENLNLKHIEDHKSYKFSHSDNTYIYLDNRIGHIKKILLLSILVISCLVLVLSLPFTLFMFKKVNTPLMYLLKQSKTIMKNPDQKFDCQRQEFIEFEKLCLSFNDMIDWLQTSEDRYRFIVENMEEGLWMINMDLEYTYASPSLEYITGYTVDEIFELTPIETIDEDDKNRLIKIFTERLDKKDYSRLTTIVKAIHKEGFEYWAEFSMAFIMDINNNPIGIQGITRDVTDRVLAESQLKEREKQFSTIFNRVQTGIVIIDPTTFQIEDANPAALDILQYSREELIGSICTDMICIHNPGQCPLIQFGRKISNRKCEMLTKEGYRNCMKTVTEVIIGGEKKFLESFIDITEQQRIEEALRESEAKYKAVFNNAQIGIFRTKTHSEKGAVWIDVNERMIQMLGYNSADELIGHSTLNAWLDLSDREKAYQLLENSENNCIRDFKTRMKVKDGTIKEVMISAIFVDNIMEGTCVDLTQQIEQERQLKKSEQKFRMMAENSSDIMWIVDTNFEFQYVSPAVTSILGYTNEEALERNFKDLLEPESYAFVMDIAQKVIEGAEISEPVNFEIQEHKKNGELRWMEISASTVRDVDGNVIGFQGVTRDVHDKKIALQKLEESEKRYRSFVQNFKGIVFQAQIGSRPIFFHGAVESITGWTEQEMLDGHITWRRIVHPDDVDKNIKTMKKLTSQPGFMDERTYRLIRKDGSICWIRESIHNICDETGSCKYLQGVITDITEQKEMEMALHQTKKMSYLGVMAAGIAHEINNPLTGIIQYGELLKEDFEDEDEEENIEIMTDILENSERIRKIIKTLLTFSRSGGDRSPRNVSDIIERSIHYSRDRLKRYKVDLEFVPLESCLVLCDENLIQQIFINLINNSIDAINESDNLSGERVIYITIQKIDNHVEIIFKDTGSGIDEKNLEKIFDPFFTTKDPGKGTGLGMSLTHSFIQDNEGTITVDSVKGEWTQFDIKFPVYSK